MKNTQQNIKVNNSNYQTKIKELTWTFQKLKNKFTDIIPQTNKNELSNIDNETYRKLICMQKDIELLKQKVQFLKNSTLEILSSSGQKYDELNIGLQQFSGSVNQLKMSVSQIQKVNQSHQQKASNWFWQFLIPIFLTIVSFVIGLFAKSCSTIMLDSQNLYQIQQAEQYTVFQSKINK